MKNRTYNFFLVAFSVILLLNSCSKDNSRLNSMERALVGQWRIDKVTYQKTFSFHSQKVAADYENLIFNFKDDRTLTETNTATGQQTQGQWQIDILPSYYYSETNSSTHPIYTYELKASILNLNSGKAELLDLQTFSISRKKAKGYKTDHKGTFTYTWVEI